jgi:metabolite-proton symporter
MNYNTETKMTSVATATLDGVALNDRADPPARSPIGQIIIACSGNVVEWFDFFVYAYTALYFAPVFFPSGDPTSQLLNTAAIFAVGFFMRPLGGWLFGRIADRQGRKTSMLLSVLMMSFGSLLIACLPTYATIGMWAPALLLVARLIQGISVGGEYGTSATYLSEVAVPGKRGFYTSFHYATIIGGQLLAVGLVALLQEFLTLDQLKNWGWRIPFFVGSIGAVVALLLRRSMEESSSHESRNHHHSGTIRGVLKYPREVAMVLGFTAGGSLLYYTFSSYMQKYLVNTAHMPAKTASLVMTMCLLVFMLAQPVFGILSDKIGRRTSMICFGLFGVLGPVLLMPEIGRVESPMMAFCLITLALVCMSFYTSISGIIKAELFPKEVRALAVGFTYAVANATFGGSAEYVALWFKSQGMESYFFWYVSVLGVVVLVASLALPKRSDDGTLSKD